MRRLIWTLIAGSVLLGAVAPHAMASDGTQNQYAGSKATPADIAEVFEAIGDLQATMAGVDEMLVSSQGRPSNWREQECRYQSLNDPLWTAREERLTAACATGKWSVPGGLSKFMSVGSCESGWNRFANNGGRYLGLFQHAASAYVGRVNDYQPPSWDVALSTRWTNSRGQIVMTARMVHASGWGAWTCA